MLDTFTDNPRGATSSAGESTSSVTTPGRGLSGLANPGALLWAALSCVVLLIGGLGPPAHAAALETVM
jgi:hypothetical protein